VLAQDPDIGVGAFSVHGGPVTTILTETVPSVSAPIFEALADELGVPAPPVLDLRDRAGWSDDAASKLPKMSALMAEAMLPEFPHINRDIVMLGLFIHDLGKCAELSWREGFQYTDDGQLVGHIARGAIWLEQKALLCGKAGHPVPKDLLSVLQHIVLSHHGRPEFGAAKLPATPEALFVSLLDNLEAKMQMATEATRGANLSEAELNGNFTDKLWALENVRFYRPDPLAEEQGVTAG